MMKRRRARECALQMIYGAEFLSDGPDIQGFWAEHKEEQAVMDFANALVRGAFAHLGEIDRAIEASAEHWEVGRMAAVDRNILRLAAYEILHRQDIPPAVSINEALEIAKRFSSEDSASFINGILDRVARSTGRAVRQ